MKTDFEIFFDLLLFRGGVTWHNFAVWFLLFYIIIAVVGLFGGWFWNSPQPYDHTKRPCYRQLKNKRR